MASRKNKKTVAQMTAHQLAKMLLAGPDLPVYRSLCREENAAMETNTEPVCGVRAGIKYWDADNDIHWFEPSGPKKAVVVQIL